MKTEYTMEVGTGKNKEIIVFEAPDGLNDRQLSDLADTALKKAKPGQTFKHPVYDKAEQTHIDTRPKPPAPKPDTSLGHNAAVAAHGAITGGNDTLNALSSDPVFGLAAKGASLVYDKLLGGKWGQPQTSGQNYLHAGVRGAVAAAPMAGAGGLPVVVSGATSALSGEGARQAGYGPGTQAAASLVGGLGGGLASARVPGLRSAPAPNALATPGRRVYDAAERLGGEKHVMAGDVGGIGAKFASAVGRMSLGGIPMADRTAKNVKFFAGVRDATAESAGRVADPAGAGQALQRGAQNWIGSSADRGAQLFDAIPIHPDAPATLSNARAALTEMTAGLKSNPRLSALIEDPKLKAYADALGKGDLSWSDLKAFRSYIGERAGAPSLQSDTSQKALKGLYAALSEDMRATAGAQGPKALQAFNRANQYWRGRQDRIQNVVSAVLGRDLNKGAMQAFEGVQKLSNAKGGDPIKLGRLMRSMSPDEADTARASVIQMMGGSAKDGVEVSHGQTFSPTEFARQWKAMDPRSKAILFNKPAVRSAMDDLAEVLGGMRNAEQFANTSKTALSLNGLAIIGKFFANPVAGVGVAAGEIAFGKAMSSPIMAKAIANLGRARTPVATRAALASIGNIGARNPDLAGVARHILHVANDNQIHLGSAAASDKPGQNKKNPETDEILKTVAEEGRRSQAQWDEEDRQQQQTELPDLQDGPPE